MNTMTALTLVKPRIPGMKEPVLGGDGAEAGLPLALTYLYPEGVKVFIDPSPSAQEGDTFLVRLNGEEVATKAIAAGSENQRAIVYVPTKLWVDELNILDYGLVRAGTEVDTSAPLKVWFHVQRPGLVDQFPNEDGHSELSLKIEQEVLDEGVDPERARQGVPVSLSYPLMRAFDQIQLDCNNVKLNHTVTQAEVDLGEPIQLKIDETTFIAAGDDPCFPLSYTVIDRVGNGPDVNSPDSAIVYLYVNLNGVWYDPPIVSEDPADAEDDPNTIDLGKLAGKPATAQVYVPRSWLKDDEIHLTCRLRTVTGTAEVLTLKETVKNTPFMYSLPVPYDRLAAVAGGTAVFNFERVSGGTALGRSYPLTVNVDGEAAPTLPRPVVVGVGQVLDPLAFPNGVTVRVEYLQDQVGDQARLLVGGTPGLGSPVFDAIAFNKNHRANFLLKPEALAANHGETLALSWELLRADTTTASDSLEVTVERIVDEDQRLPIPTIPQSLNNKVLDFGSFTGPVQVLCAPWPSIGVGQMRWFRLHGVDVNDVEYVIPIALGALVTQPEKDNGLDNTVPRDLLLKYKPGNTLRVVLKVAFNGQNNEADAVVFPARELTVLNLAAQPLEDFTGVLAQIVRQGGVIDLSSMQITFKSGDGEVAITPRTEIGESFPGQIEGQVLSIGRDAFGADPLDVELKLKKSCSAVSFWHVSSNYDNSTVSYYNATGLFLGTQKLGMSYGSPVSVSFEAQGIARLDFHCPTPDWFSVDNFRVAD